MSNRNSNIKLNEYGRGNVIKENEREFFRTQKEVIDPKI